jgi:hypothetical protein
MCRQTSDPYPFCVWMKSDHQHSLAEQIMDVKSNGFIVLKRSIKPQLLGNVSGYHVCKSQLGK